ncbi:MAG: ATP-binding cassette domain-containing protein, partial [Acidimicrobiia bacterium]
MAATLLARDLSVSYGARVILDRVELVIAAGDRVGVLGPNGTGKSTLLRALGGLLAPDKGAVTLSPATATVGYLPQERDRLPGETVLGLLARRTGVAEASAALDVATAALTAAGPDTVDLAAERYSLELERWLALGGDDLAARSAQCWSELGMAEALLEQEATTLSGGQ